MMWTTHCVCCLGGEEVGGYFQNVNTASLIYCISLIARGTEPKLV